MYPDQRSFREGIGWFRNSGYRVIEFDATRWTDEQVVAEDLRVIFKEYGNSTHRLSLDEFVEVLEDFDVPSDGGTCLAFQRYDSFASALPRKAQELLEVIADASRYHLLFGNRLFALIQSDDPRLKFQPIGCLTVL
jgi:hypothetical protein